MGIVDSELIAASGAGSARDGYSCSEACRPETEIDIEIMRHTKQFDQEVTRFLDGLDHPFRKEIDALRSIILEAGNDLEENVKWNAPNYSLRKADRITMKILPAGKPIQVIFHLGARGASGTVDKLIDDSSGLLSWKGNDRAVATFRNMEEIESRKSDFGKIVKAWLKVGS